MSNLSDFYGSRPNPLAVAEAFSVGGRTIEVRPLTLDEVLRLWDACRPWLARWATFVLSSRDLGAMPGDEAGRVEWLSAVAAFDVEWFEPAMAECLRVIWGRHGVDWRRDVLETSTAAELWSVLNWYREFHDWSRIFDRVFGLTVDAAGELIHDGGDENPLLDLYRIERNGGRTIEECLSMRVEAYLSLLDVADEWVGREDRLDRAAATGKKAVVHDPRLFGIGMPGFGGFGGG